MATVTKNGPARVWREDWWFPATGWWYIEHTVETVITDGYTTYASALAAAGSQARGRVATIDGGPCFWAVTVETDTIGELTIYDPQPT
jgi:hypothetical protein